MGNAKDAKDAKDENFEKFARFCIILICILCFCGIVYKTCENIRLQQLETFKFCVEQKYQNCEKILQK